MSTSAPSERIRFGEFELDLQTGELLTGGRRTRLQDQPFQILVALLDRQGGLVTRDELTRKLWPNNTFVDFDQSLNKAINKLRAALNDSAGTPRFIETLPRRGYRFVAVVEAIPKEGDAERKSAGDQSGTSVEASPSRYWICAIAAVALLATVVGAIRNLASPNQPRIESIAVLPLTNMSGDPQQDYFSEGMTDEVIRTLAQIKALRVTSRTSIMQFKARSKSIPQIARELNVDGIVAGSVLRSGSRVRISVELIHGATDRHIWSQSFERDSRDVIALQGNVARDIAREINATLTKPEHQILSRAQEVEPVARESYLWGRYFLNKFSENDARKSVEYFEAAIRQEPKYAQAYTGLAEAYQELAFYDSPRVVAPKTREAAMKAIELDDTLATAHAALAWVKWSYEWDWVGAEDEFRRAIELGPSDAALHASYGSFLNSRGQLQEGEAEHLRAQQLDPLSLSAALALAGDRYLAHRFDESILHYKKLVDIDPHYAPAHEGLGDVYAQQGMKEEAVSEWVRSAEEYGLSDMAATFRRLYAKSGYGAALHWELLQLTGSDSGGHYESAIHVAAISARLGEREETFKWLDKAFADRDGDLVMIAVDPVFDTYRNDLRFQHLLVSLGLNR